jgi:protein NrfD
MASPRGPRPPGGEAYPAVLALAAAALIAMVLYNRAQHFGWRSATRPLLGTALLLGVAGIGLSAPLPGRALFVASDLTSVVLLGAAAGAMILGHWYLVVLDLPISALRRLTVLLAVGLVLRSLVVAIVLLGPAHAGLESLQLVARGLWSPDGIFIWMRLLFGIAGPISLIWFIWKTVEIRSTQSATGILYVQLFLVMSGELLAKYLRVAAGLPL